jgi:hypothetical protein
MLDGFEQLRRLEGLDEQGHAPHGRGPDPQGVVGEGRNEQKWPSKPGKSSQRYHSQSARRRHAHVHDRHGDRGIVVEVMQDLNAASGSDHIHVLLREHVREPREPAWIVIGYQYRGALHDHLGRASLLFLAIKRSSIPSRSSRTVPGVSGPTTA